MKLEYRTAHELLDNFVKWHRVGNGSSAAISPFARLIKPTARPSGVSLDPWYCDEYALLTNTLLTHLKLDRPKEFKMVMFYYFGGHQRLDLTGEKFNIYPTKVKVMIESGRSYIDGMMRGMAA